MNQREQHCRKSQESDRQAYLQEPRGAAHAPKHEVDEHQRRKRLECVRLQDYEAHDEDDEETEQKR